jgi:glycerol-3-phosphate dehydrogenase
LVIERVLAARQEGAHCLNYVETVLLLSQPEGVEVRYRDNRGAGQGAIRAGIVVNTAGVACAQSGGLTTAELSSLFKFSRGSHLLFNKPWVGPALVLPIREAGARIPGRYYFITPHPGGTLVGTTEREVKECERDPLPSEDEIRELLGRVAEDVPGAGLVKDRAYYCFAGYRALPVGEGRVDALSRRHRWVSRKRILTLVGGKYTSAAWTCEDGFRHLLSISGLRLKRIVLSSRVFPGAAFFGTRVAEFEKACREAQIPPPLVSGAVRRFGGRVIRLLDWSDGLEAVGGLILKGELRLAIEHEQAETLEDVVRRRLEIEQLPGHGIPQLEAMATAGVSLVDDHQIELYRKRMSQIRELIDRA